MLKGRMEEVAPHSVHKIHLGRDNDEKWTVLEPSVQTHLYFKEKDAGEQEEMREIGAYIIGISFITL